MLELTPYDGNAAALAELLNYSKADIEDDDFKYTVFQKDANIYLVANSQYLKEMIPPFEIDSSFD